MKVLMTADAVGGVWTFVAELTRGLPDVKFVVATMGRRPLESQQHELGENATLAIGDFKLEWEADPWRDVDAASNWLLALEQAERPDVVHLNGYAHGVLPFEAPKLMVAHSCVLSWWRAVKGEDAPSEWDTYRRRVEDGLRGANLVAAPSAWMLGALDAHYHFGRPARLIYNGRSEYAGPIDGDRQMTVFAAGRMWDEAKNLKSVVAAAPQISVPVRVAGDGGASSVNLTHLGRLDYAVLQQELRRSSIYLFPALYEPFGLSILEAAQAGCALILGDIPSLRELWRDAALFVPPNDPEAIARVTNEVVTNVDLREELARRAHARSAQYSADRMAETYRGVYETLAREKAEAVLAAKVRESRRAEALG